MMRHCLSAATSKNVMKMFKVGLISSVLLISACSILPKSEPLTRYNLPAATIPAVDTHKNTSLFIAVPQASRLINSNNILVQPDGTEIQIYKGTQWSDSAPVLLRGRLVRALNDAGLFNAISANAAINTPWALESYLYHFEVQYQDGQPVVNLQFEAQLINRHDSSIVHSKRFAIAQPTADTSIPSAINAFGLASDNLSLQLIDWLKSINF